MEKIIAAFDARRNFGRILQAVLSRGERFVVERHGEPVAAVVPIEVYEQWKKARGAFFARIRATAQRADLPPDEAEALAEEAVRAVRTAPNL
ncbi:MAG: type II toxin-antitoxin system Phd/YefM family antitoxin [Chloroflexi bacterium]|nr:type II toxin-antitoxin system Phd/YefM family antitoxin [Chloroflexota bacterium]MBI4504906.1 type II toxin-antitoxin system Phd/YefM family antitoxin [Chloroflexota bacterium]